MEFFKQDIFDFNDSFDYEIASYDGFPVWHVENVYKDPYAVREYALSCPTLCHKRFSSNSKNGIEYFDGQCVAVSNDCPNKRELLEHIAKYYKTRYENCNPRFNIFNKFSTIKDPPSDDVVWFPHTDGMINVLIYLNPFNNNGPGTTLYDKTDDDYVPPNEHDEPWISKTKFLERICFLDRFNTLIAFPGHMYHAMTVCKGYFQKEERVVEVRFF